MKSSVFSTTQRFNYGFEQTLQPKIFGQNGEEMGREILLLEWRAKGCRVLGLGVNGFQFLIMIILIVLTSALYEKGVQVWVVFLNFLMKTF